MPQSAQIKCVNKQPRNDLYHRIVNVGGFTDRAWKISEDAAIQFIERREWEFHTLVDGKRANVVIAVHNGRKYLKTTADGDIPDNLLSLPECP